MNPGTDKKLPAVETATLEQPSELHHWFSQLWRGCLNLTVTVSLVCSVCAHACMWFVYLCVRLSVQHVI